MNEIVFYSNGKLVTDSLRVAEVFKKRHFHVIDAIKNILNSTEKSCQFYVSTTYTDEIGRELPMYIMDRDGYSFLAMGFTGKKAMKFKIDFIGAFNKMEAELRRANPDPTEKKLSTTEMFFLSAQSQMEQAKEILAIGQKADAIERRVSNIELVQKCAETELFTLPLVDKPPEAISQKDQVRLLVNRYAGATLIPQPDIWKELYSALYYRYHINIRARDKSDKETYLDVAARIGCLPELHAIISDKIKSAKRT